MSTTDDLAAFCAAHPAGSFGAPTLRRLLESLVRGPDAIVDLADARGRALVAVVIDTCAGVRQSAQFNVLGRRADTAADLFEKAVRAALDVTRAGPLRVLDAELPERARGEIAVLQRLDFTEAYRGYDMVRTAPFSPSDACEPPSGWRFVSADEARAREHHDVVTAAFATIPGSFVPPLAEFTRAIGAGPRIQRLLLDPAGTVDGFVAVEPDESTSTHVREGEVATIGRRPQTRGAGLGPVLLGEGLRLLADAGCSRFRLSVVAENRRALALYERTGFTVTRELITFGRAVA